MAKKIILTKTAQADRVTILQYWIEHNKSNSYSLKLDKLFRDNLKLLSLHPFAGIKTSDEGIYSYVVLNYKLFYRIENDSIIVLRVWDTRRDPDTVVL